MRTEVQPLVFFSGLRIRCWQKLWYRSQVWLRFCVAVAVCSDSTPSLRTSIGRRCGPKKKKKKIENLNNTINKLDLTDRYTHTEREISAQQQNTCSQAHIENILGQETPLNNFKRIEILQGLLSDHSGIKLEISNRKIKRKYPNV